MDCSYWTILTVKVLLRQGANVHGTVGVGKKEDYDRHYIEEKRGMHQFVKTTKLKLSARIEMHGNVDALGQVDINAYAYRDQTNGVSA